MNLVADDGATRVDERVEAVDDLSIADAQRGDVDDVAVLRLHGRRLDVEDHELRRALGELRAKLHHRVRLGPDEGHLLGRAGRRDQLLLQVDALLELLLPVGNGIGHDRFG